jgi:hypothetical protein
MPRRHSLNNDLAIRAMSAKPQISGNRSAASL